MNKAMGNGTKAHAIYMKVTKTAAAKYHMNFG